YCSPNDVTSPYTDRSGRKRVFSMPRRRANIETPSGAGLSNAPVKRRNSMRFIFGVLIASVSFAGVALADPQANLYSNTVVITSAAGVSKAFVNEDHSYTTTFPDGKVVKGSWAVQGDEVCYTQTDP